MVIQLNFWFLGLPLELGPECDHCCNGKSHFTGWTGTISTSSLRPGEPWCRCPSGSPSSSYGPCREYTLLPEIVEVLFGCCRWARKLFINPLDIGVPDPDLDRFSEMWRKRAGNTGMHATIIPTACSRILDIKVKPCLLHGFRQYVREHGHVHDNDGLIRTFGLAGLVAEATDAGYYTAIPCQCLRESGSRFFQSTYSEPTAKTTETRIFWFLAICKPQIATIGTINIIRSETTLMTEAHIRTAN